MTRQLHVIGSLRIENSKDMAAFWVTLHLLSLTIPSSTFSNDSITHSPSGKACGGALPAWARIHPFEQHHEAGLGIERQKLFLSGLLQGQLEFAVAESKKYVKTEETQTYHHPMGISSSFSHHSTNTPSQYSDSISPIVEESAISSGKLVLDAFHIQEKGIVSWPIIAKTEDDKILRH